MVQFEFTERIRGAIEQMLNSGIKMPEEERKKFTKILYTKPATIDLEDLKLMSQYLQKVPADSPTKFVHELVVGSRVMSPKKGKKEFSPTTIPTKNPMRIKGEQKWYQRMVRSISFAGQDDEDNINIKVMNEHMSFGANVIIAMVVLYFSAYFVAYRTYGNMTIAVIAGVACATVALLVETWLFMIRSERAEQKYVKKHGPGSPLPVSPMGVSLSSAIQKGEVGAAQTPLGGNAPGTPLYSQ